MKRIGIIICGTLLSTGLFAQNDVDALKYSWNNSLTGTARSTAMGGAFSALGGDVSSISMNPAGLGVYRSSEFVFTPVLYYNRTEADYLKSTYSDEKYNFNLNNLAWVGNISRGLSGGWESLNFALGYNRKNNYNQHTLISGDMEMGNLTTGDTLSSLLDNFTYWANVDDPYGEQYHEVDWPQGDLIMDRHYEELICNVDLILYQVDSLHPNGGYWWNEMYDDGYNQRQRKTIRTKGSNGEYYFAMGSNYNHHLYIGASLGYHHFREEYVSVHTETDFRNVINYIHDFSFTETFTTWGNGIDFKVGAIYKPIDLIRISGSFHTPTFYKVNMEFSNSAESNSDPEYGSIYLFDYRYAVGYNYYKLRTPLKAIGGIAFQIEKIALLSFDYEYVDYSKMRVDAHPDDILTPELEEWIANTNNTISKKYKPTHNVRGGLELRNGPLSIRGGASYYDSPFSSKEVNKNAYTIFYTGGIGFRSDEFFIDFAYLYGLHQEKYYQYYPPAKFGEPEATNLSSTYNKFMVTIGFRF